MKIKSIIAGITLTLAAGSAVASEGFSILEGIPTEAMSSNEMGEVEGRWFFNYFIDYTFHSVGWNSVFFIPWSLPVSNNTSQKLFINGQEVHL